MEKEIKIYGGNQEMWEEAWNEFKKLSASKRKKYFYDVLTIKPL